MRKIQISRQPVVAVLYAEPGMGKTSLACTAPGPIILLDFDRGAHRAAPGILPENSFQPSTYDEVVEWLWSDEPARLGASTLVVDTLGAFLEDFVTPWVAKRSAKATRSDGQLSMQGWGALKQEFKRFFSRCRELGWNIVFVAHAKESEETGRTFDVPGGAASVVKRSADLIGYLTRTHEGLRIDFRPLEGQAGKSAPGIEIVDVPDLSDPAYPRTMADLFTTYRARIEALEAQAKAKAADLAARIQSIANAADLSELVAIQPKNGFERAEWAKAFREHIVALLPDVTDAKALQMVTDLLQEAKPHLDRGALASIWAMVQAQGKEAGFLFDKAAKRWVPVDTSEEE